MSGIGPYLSTRAIPEKSLYSIAPAYLPFIGSGYAWIREAGLRSKIEKVILPVFCAELIRTQNKYKTADVVRNLSEISLIVAGISYSVISGVGVYFFGVLAITRMYCIFRCILEIQHNNQTKDMIRASGNMTGAIVY